MLIRLKKDAVFNRMTIPAGEFLLFLSEDTPRKTASGILAVEVQFLYRGEIIARKFLPELLEMYKTETFDFIPD